MNEIPVCWGDEHDFDFEHVKSATRHKWQQTRRVMVTDEGSKRKTGGAVTTASQDSPTFGEAETAIRFGFSARVEYDASFPQWDHDLEFKLAREWLSLNPTPLATWEQAREAVRYGWTFEDVTSQAAVNTVQKSALLAGTMQ